MKISYRNFWEAFRSSLFPLTFHLLEIQLMVWIHIPYVSVSIDRTNIEWFGTNSLRFHFKSQWNWHERYWQNTKWVRHSGLVFGICWSKNFGVLKFDDLEHVLLMRWNDQIWKHPCKNQESVNLWNSWQFHHRPFCWESTRRILNWKMRERKHCWCHGVCRKGEILESFHNPLSLLYFL